MFLVPSGVGPIMDSFSTHSSLSVRAKVFVARYPIPALTSSFPKSGQPTSSYGTVTLLITSKVLQLKYLLSKKPPLTRVS